MQRSKSALSLDHEEVPLRAELFFVAGLLIFGGGTMAALAYGVPWTIAIFALVGLMLAITPYARGWVRDSDTESKRPEVLTIEQYGVNKSYPLDPVFKDEETGIYGEWDNMETPEQQEWRESPEP